MKYWLFKSEPEEFGIDDLKKKRSKTEHWDGVRNYQARNFMRDDMKIGDQGFFYHSNCDVPGIVGIVEVVKEGYVDHTAFDPDDKHYDPKSDPDKPRWFMVDVKFVERFPDTISLQQLKTNPKLADMRLVQKGNRLSVMPVEKKEWTAILKMIK
jgi:predicted RNA-binding protein with PUA-like domain